MILTYWLIRHVPTGQLLPARTAATQYDFDSPNESLEPRLFKTESAAKRCATYWSQGVWVKIRRTEWEGWKSPPYERLSEPEPHEVPGRSRDQLEVVPCTLLVGAWQAPAQTGQTAPTAAQPTGQAT